MISLRRVFLATVAAGSFVLPAVATITLRLIS